MHIGQLLSLKWPDLDLVNTVLSITKTYYNPNNNQIVYELLPPKTKKLIRMRLKMKQRLIYNDNNFIFAENNEHPRVLNKVGLRLEQTHKTYEYK